MSSKSSSSPARLGGNTGVKLLRSVAKGDLGTVRALFQKRGKALLHVFGLDGCTPFLLACKKGQLEVAKFLLADQGASITDRDKDPKRQGNAIHYACWGGHMHTIVWLLSLGASLDEVDVVGNTPLLYAIYGGHLAVVEELLRRGRSLREKNSKNHTAILQASCGGHLQLVEWLINKGFTLAETDNDGNTALLFAAWGGHRALMEYLLRFGASLDEKNNNGHSVFLSAANGGRIDIVEWLLKQGFDIGETNNNGDTALLLAAYGGHLQLVQRLLELGATLADRNACGFTPLLSAANGGQLEMAEWLLDNGSSLTERDNDGYSSLILAACGGNVQLVKFFLDRGSSLTERNNNGDSALLLAAYCGHVDLVDWLLDNGSKLGERNNTGMGLLVSAANGGQVDVVRLVLERQGGQGLEDTDEGGYTPLLLAAQRGHVEVVQFLASHGASLRARTRRHHNDARSLSLDSPEMLEYLNYIWDMTPLQIACDARIVDCVHVALLNGVDPNATMPTALAICSAQGPYVGSKPPCPETTSLLRMASEPWSPRTHVLHGPMFRKGVMAVFNLQYMLNASSDSPLPYLPQEMWMHIASFYQRSWFPTDTSYATSGTIAAAGGASAFFHTTAASVNFSASTTSLAAPLPTLSRRRDWRKRRLGFSSDDAEVAMVEEEEAERPEMYLMDSAPILHATLAGDVKSSDAMSESSAGSGAPAATGSASSAAVAAAAAAAATAVAAHGFRITWV